MDSGYSLFYSLGEPHDQEASGLVHWVSFMDSSPTTLSQLVNEVPIRQLNFHTQTINLFWQVKENRLKRCFLNIMREFQQTNLSLSLCVYAYVCVLVWCVYTQACVCLKHEAAANQPCPVVVFMVIPRIRNRTHADWPILAADLCCQPLTPDPWPVVMTPTRQEFQTWSRCTTALMWTGTWTRTQGH